MTQRSYRVFLLPLLAAMVSLLTPLGCADESALYIGEPLNYETPSRKQEGENKLSELDLAENEKSEFSFYGGYPWGPAPLFDYYRTLYPVAVPIGPGFAVLDYVHPFYAYASMVPYWGYDDDDC